MTRWDDLNARARGLSTRLLGRATLEGLSRAPDLPAIAAELQHRGFPIVDPERVSAGELELAIRRNLGARLATLIRWAGPRSAALAVLIEDEDRRSISDLLRGAAQRAPAEQRLSGLLPTPELPERALEELAAQPSVGAVASLLTVWHHPFASTLLPEASRPEPDLLRLETALASTFAGRALAQARRDGRGGILYRYVQEVIDVANAFAALMLSAEQATHVEEQWLRGGRVISLELFRRAVATGNPAAAGRSLAQAFTDREVGTAFATGGSRQNGLERAVLSAQIAELRQSSRLAPLSSAPLLSYALRLRAEALDLRWLLWGHRLGAPPLALVEGLVTAP
jgi:vacuolar-type H+-ATPase subunit C/Vma6